MKFNFIVFSVLVLSKTQMYADPKYADPRLNNVGNSCFFNATMQALAHVKSFRDKIKQIESTKINNVKSEYEKTFSKEFVALIKQMADPSNSYKTINPKSTYDAMIAVAIDRSKGTQKYLVGRDKQAGKAGDQHDPAEVLDLLLFKSFGESGCDVLINALDTFKIKLNSETRRATCGHITSSDDGGTGRNWIEFDLTNQIFDEGTSTFKIQGLKSANLINFCKELFLEGEERPYRCDWCTAKEWIKKSKITKTDLGPEIFSALEKDSYTENINSKIENCKKYKDLIKTEKIVERTGMRTKKFNAIPTAIIFDFKRFLQSETGALGEKLETQLSFPLALDIFPYVSLDLKSKLTEITKITYNLKSFICHGGDELGVGHHYAYGWSDIDKCWYCLSDTSISKANDIKSRIEDNKAPFILFYELDDVSRKELEKLRLIEPDQQGAFQQKLTNLKTSLQTLKTKLQRVRDKLKVLHSKL
jgi:uncharacterized UBP type Zn finger protein